MEEAPLFHMDVKLLEEVVKVVRRIDRYARGVFRLLKLFGKLISTPTPRSMISTLAIT